MATTHHQRLVIGRADGDTLEAVEDHIEDRADGGSLLLAALLKAGDELIGYVHRRAKFDDGS